jgi:alkylation response protein AidB-like acyl-CoA dehydrogenase
MPAGGVWAAAVGASVAYSRSRRRAAPQRAAGPRLVHARALTLAALGGAAAAFVHYRSSSSSRAGSRSAADRMDLDFYSQLPPAAEAAWPLPAAFR